MNVNDIKKKQREFEHKMNPIDTTPIIDWTYYLDSSNFIRSVLAPSKYGEEIAQYDDYEVREFCRKHDLHTDSELIEFAWANTDFTMSELVDIK